MSLVPKSAEFSLGASRHLLLAKLGALVAAGLIVACREFVAAGLGQTARAGDADFSGVCLCGRLLAPPP